MWSDYSNMIEFKMLRDRIESRLNHGLLLLAHVMLFLATLGYFIWELRLPFFAYRTDLIQPERADFMLAWMLVLGAHALFTVVRSGLQAGRRDRVIERELRERMEQDDTRLLSDPRDVLRVHGLLADNIQRRARAIIPLFAFLLVTLVIWIWSRTAVVGAWVYSSGAWQVTLVLAVPFGVWLFLTQSLRYAVDVRLDDYAEKAKPKRDDFDHNLAALARGDVVLGDDGELFDFTDEQDKRKLQRG